MSRRFSIARLLAVAGVFVAGFGASACCSCDPDDEAHELAGDAAFDCGFAPVGTDRAGVVDCVLAARERLSPFVGGWGDIGRDSAVRSYVASDGTSVWVLGYDSDPSGGDEACETLVSYQCGSALVRFSSPGRPDIASCERYGDKRQLCGG